MPVSKITSLSISSISKIYGIELSKLSSIYGQNISITPVWLDGWDYRKSITLSRASGAVTNYQMKLLVGESSGATGEDVDCGGKCLSSFNDLRFTTSDGTTLLDYWIESISGTTPNQLATVWIEFGSIGTGATTFYMYYGNAAASAVSSGSNTFIYFQEFNALNDAVLNGQDSWSGSTNFSVQSSVKFEGAKAVTISTGGTTSSIARSIAGITSFNMFVQARLYVTNVSRTYIMGLYIRQGTTQISAFYLSAYRLIHLVTAGWGDVETASSTTWYKIRMAFDAANTHKIWLDDTLKSPASNANYNNVTTTIDNILLEQYTDSSAVGYVDQIFIGQYLATEPAWGSWGAEETT